MNLLIVVSLTLTAALLGFLSGYACSARRIKRQIRALGQTPVSYTHLDVYKRQPQA